MKSVLDEAKRLPKGYEVLPKALVMEDGYVYHTTKKGKSHFFFVGESGPCIEEMFPRVLAGHGKCQRLVKW